MDEYEIMNELLILQMRKGNHEKNGANINS